MPRAVAGRIADVNVMVTARLLRPSQDAVAITTKAVGFPGGLATDGVATRPRGRVPGFGNVAFDSITSQRCEPGGGAEPAGYRGAGRGAEPASKPVSLTPSMPSNSTIGPQVDSTAANARRRSG